MATDPAVTPTLSPEREAQERQLFATHMERMGFGAQAVAPPKPPMRHYRSSHVETCWEAWCGCLQAHHLT